LPFGHEAPSRQPPRFAGARNEVSFAMRGDVKRVAVMTISGSSDPEMSVFDGRVAGSGVLTLAAGFVLALHAPSAMAINAATDVRASAWMRFPVIMSDLLCGLALE
jgi:hypothetical protein